MRKKILLAFGAACTAFGFSTPASAALVLGSTACSLTDITPAASDCGGWYQGNLNGGSPTMKADSAAALNAMLGTSYTGPTLTWLEDLTVSGNTVNFVTPLFGDTVVSFHVGAAVGDPAGVGYQSTAFFRFDAGNAPGGLDSFDFNRAGLSNARLYYTGTTPAVPEPSTWAMMLLGFGAIGFAMRRRKDWTARGTVRLSYS
jgi:hypothetical protein